MIVIVLVHFSVDVSQVLKQIFVGHWRTLVIPGGILIESEACVSIRVWEQEVTVAEHDRTKTTGETVTPLTLRAFTDDRHILSYFSSNGTGRVGHSCDVGQLRESLFSLFQMHGGSVVVKQWTTDRGVSVESESMMDVIVRCAKLVTEKSAASASASEAATTTAAATAAVATTSIVSIGIDMSVCLVLISMHKYPVNLVINSNKHNFNKRFVKREADRA